jgi:hypothetical protein
LPELKQALGTSVDTTVFRKLKELSCRSSYSHRGRYYTLAGIPQFDTHGLWSSQAVWFSRWGNLVTILEAPVNGAPQSYFANEGQGCFRSAERSNSATLSISASLLYFCRGQKNPFSPSPFRRGTTWM